MKYLSVILALTILSCQPNNSSDTIITESTQDIDIVREIQVQRATQAVIWALPAVTIYNFGNSIIRDLGGKTGTIAYMSQTMNSRHSFITANNVTPYVIAGFSVKDGPVVVEIPPASNKTSFFGSFVDAWFVPVADVGPTGSDKGKGGKYLFLPPGHEGETPKGFIVIPLRTNSFHCAFRPVSTNGGSIAEAAEYSQTMKTYSLSEASNPPTTEFVDAFPKDWNTLPRFDFRYFEDLWAIIQSEPIQERDKVMMGLLATLGIEKGKPFNPSAEEQTILEEGVEKGFNYFQTQFTTPGKSLFPYYGGDNYWQAFNIPKDQAENGFLFVTDDRVLVEERALAYIGVTYYPVKLGPASVYLMGVRDQNGELFNGNETYKLNVPADTPAKDFWSVIVYSMQSKGFIKNSERVGLASTDMDNLRVNDDGSVDIYFAPEPPAYFEKNWISTGEDFLLCFRLYGPKESAFDKTWKLSNVEKIQ